MAYGCYNAAAQYLPASFKAVPFDALEISSEHGRRGAEGEFVFGEQTGYVDLGRKIRTYTIAGRFADNNHAIMAELLIKVAEMPGPGILVHPTRGIIRAACRSLRIRDNPTESMGITEFDAEFVEAQLPASGLGKFLNIANIGTKTMMALAGGSFKNLFNPAQMGGYFRNALVGAMGAGIGAIGSAYAGATLGAIGGIGFGLAEAAITGSGGYNRTFGRSRQTMATAASGQNAFAAVSAAEDRAEVLAEFEAVQFDPELAADPETAEAIVRNGLDFIARDADDAPAAENAFLTIINWAAKTSALPNKRAAAAENAVYGYLRLTALCKWLDIITELPAENIETALRDYSRAKTVLEDEQAAAEENAPDLFLALADFAAEAEFMLLNRAYSAAPLIHYNLPGTTHSLSAAWEIFGDAKRTEDLFRFNDGLPWAIGPFLTAIAAPD